MTDILERICADKRVDLARRQSEMPLPEIEAAARAAPTPRPFADRLQSAGETGYGLIAEIKRASPSQGLIREDFDVATLAAAYERGGATCLSVITDTPYFQGDDAFLAEARAAVGLPLLRKDFMLDPYQIVESRALGADCVLLIMSTVDDETALALRRTAADHGMDVLFEVHDEAELERALRLDPRLIGVNNRNLKTFEVDLGTTEALAPHLPADVLLVAESGLHSAADLARLARAGATRFLVGESLMRQSDVEAATRTLLALPTSAAATA